MKLIKFLSIFALLSAISAAEVKAGIVAVLDSGFQTPDVSGGDAYAPGGTAWVYSVPGPPNGSGVAANGGAFGVTGSPTGQAGFIEGISTITQTLSVTSPGTYYVSFDWEGRNGFGANPISVSLGGQTLTLSPNTPTTLTSFSPMTTGSATLGAGSADLVFTGLLSGYTDDTTTFIDNVAVTEVPVPEPSSWAWLACLGTVAFVAWRRFPRQASI